MKLDKESLDKMISMYLSKDYTIEEIGKEFGVSGWTITNEMRKNNIPKRKFKVIHSKIISKEEEKDIIKLYKFNRITIPELADRYNTSSCKIYRVLKENRVPTNKRSPKKLKLQPYRKEILELYNNDESLEKIALIYKCSIATVRSFLYSMGVKIRPRHSKRIKGNKKVLKQIKIEYKMGLSLNYISSKNNISLSYLKKIIRDLGLKSRKSKYYQKYGNLSKYHETIIHRYVEEKCSLIKLSIELGTSVYLLKRYLSSINVPIRKK